MFRRSNGRPYLKSGPSLLIGLCIAITLWLAIYPFGRVFNRVPFDYNEGWNVYNTQKVAEHQPLYASASGWTMANYPPLSFHLVAALSKITHDYLFTARVLSLIALCINALLAGLIVFHASRSRFAGILTAGFVIALFCANDTSYVGMDDPQILAQAFFLAGIFAYLRGGRNASSIDLAVVLFVLGGNIKHNLIEFPLAVLLDLLFTSWRKALRFALVGSFLALGSVLLTRHFDGGAYVDCLLAPRGYSLPQSLVSIRAALLPLLLPTLASIWIAPFCWKHPSRRVLVLLFVCALAVDTFFSGGEGVDANIFFGYTLAVALLTGLFCAEVPQSNLSRFVPLSTHSLWAFFFLFSLAAHIYRHPFWPASELRADRAGSQRFTVEVSYLRNQSGPALCEELLECFYAGKPYLYDPFNASRLMKQGHLDPEIIVDQLKAKHYAAVQLYGSVEELLAGSAADNVTPPVILRAVEEYYQPGLDNEDGVIYVPKERHALSDYPPCLTGTVIRSRQILGRSARRGLCHLVKCPECGHMSDGHGRHLRHMRIEDYLHPTNPSSNPHKSPWFNNPEKLPKSSGSFSRMCGSCKKQTAARRPRSMEGIHTTKANLLFDSRSKCRTASTDTGPVSM